MIFNSIEFLFFLIVVFTIYWSVFNNKIKAQNILLLLASYFFYGLWDWRFLTLILFSTIIDYAIGYLLSKKEDIKIRKALLWSSILVNLGFLGFFKYYNFFVQSFIDSFSFLTNNQLTFNTLNIILPVGISFYTFQTLSYTIDVYKRKLEPSKDFIAFASFVSFFPQLVAGPIERASNLLPQFYIKRKFSYKLATDGLQQMLWGFFKKMVIADKCAVYANIIFDNSDSYSGSTLLLGAIFFAIQIYGDFSGYSDIAIGVSKLFGFNLKKNFATPYFSRDIAEFWRRWHISLSTWFRDYLYIPLGGSKGNQFSQLKNVLIIFIVSGFWHGANWTFVVWGALNAIYFIPLLILKLNRKNTGFVAENKLLPSIKEIIQMSITFVLTCIAWIFFRANSIAHALHIIEGIFSKTFFTRPHYDMDDDLKMMFLLLTSFLIVEWFGRSYEHVLQFTNKTFNKPIRIIFYYLILLTIFLFKGKAQEFIYFQF